MYIDYADVKVYIQNKYKATYLAALLFLETCILATARKNASSYLIPRRTSSLILQKGYRDNTSSSEGGSWSSGVGSSPSPCFQGGERRDVFWTEYQKGRVRERHRTMGLRRWQKFPWQISVTGTQVLLKSRWSDKSCYRIESNVRLVSDVTFPQKSNIWRHSLRDIK